LDNLHLRNVLRNVPIQERNIRLWNVGGQLLFCMYHFYAIHNIHSVYGKVGKPTQRIIAIANSQKSQIHHTLTLIIPNVNAHEIHPKAVSMFCTGHAII
jgi:hypothetical protein